MKKLLLVLAVALVGGTLVVSGAAPSLSQSAVDDEVTQSQTQTQYQQQLYNTSFEVDDLDAPENATAGSTIVVGAEVTNPGDVPMIQHVEFRLNGDVVVRKAFALNPGETENVTFEVNTTGVSPGTYVHSVQTQDFGEVDTIEITEPASTETPTDTPDGNETTTAPDGNETTTAPSGNETTTAPSGNETTAS